MDIGIFNTPYALGYAQQRCGAGDVINWDLQMTAWADEYGLAEAFFAEHYTIGNEPSPSPDVMIAAASQRTHSIKLGAAAHLLPYHNPINLAHRLMWLDHMTGGRYIAGFAPGSFPTDAQLFATGSENNAMMAEALDIITAIWTREPPFRIEGKYWTVDMPAYSDAWRGPHLKSLQDPAPEIVVTGMQATSPTFIDAGRRNLSPMSQQVSLTTLTQQWETYTQAAELAGHMADRTRWRVVRDIFVADTDAEARRLVLDGAAGHTWESLVLPSFKAVRVRGESRPYAIGELLIDPDMTIDQLTVEWLADNFWLVGSPDTVAEKMARLNDDLGGVGAVVSFTFDYRDDPDVYQRHFQLLGQQVAPQVKAIGPRAVSHA